MSIDPIVLVLLLKSASQALELALAGRKGQDEAMIADALVDVISRAQFAYEQQTGRPLDPPRS